MNQDHVKQILLDIKEDVADFQLIFSGKSSRKVNGLYKPQTMEIIIHNHNFSNDNELIYTAIHEFAHHIHFTHKDNVLRRVSRAHNSEFYTLFYELLEKAEACGYYQPSFNTDDQLTSITQQLQNDVIASSGKLMKKMGDLLLQAQTICREKGLRFDDYLDRVLQLPRQSAAFMMKAKALQLDEKLGYERMKVAAQFNDPLRREQAVSKMLDQTPIEQVKHQLKPKHLLEPMEKLQKERDRVGRSIERLNSYLLQIEEEIKKMEKLNASSY